MSTHYPHQSTAVILDTSRSAHARLRPVPLTAVQLTDNFWAPRRRLNREVTLPSQYRHCEETGRIDNFRRAAGWKDVPFQGIYFNDSDVFKWVEAAAWTLAAEEDAELRQMMDTVVDAIVAAQQPDGYLNTYFLFEHAAERWSNLRDMHELYCAGHLIQAAIAHHRATGSDVLLNAARRYADLICETFGPATEGKLELTDGHPEIEMALIELARTTGDEKYLRQAQFFVDVRGRGLLGSGANLQDHQPFRELHDITGHAVRAVYLNAGVADIYAETGEAMLRESLDRLWDSMALRRMYITGGIGSRYEGEAFGEDYELPNARAYAETCAAIGSFMWNWRMLQLDGEAKYADLMELLLYNVIIAGISLDGKDYFYQNPLADDGRHRRQPWFGCACCPPNMARFLASLPGYFYSTSVDGIWVHLYASGTAHIELPDGREVVISQRTDYPWDGKIEIAVEAEGEFTLYLRVPGNVAARPSMEVNGETVFADGQILEGYVPLRRHWQADDHVHLELSLPVQSYTAHPYIIENRGQVALKRGPVLFCVEQADNPGIELRDVVLPTLSDRGIDLVCSTTYRPAMLGGVATIEFEAWVLNDVPGSDTSRESAYPPRARRDALRRGRSSRAVTLTAIPYYAWANREAGRMMVWLRAE
jgi:hypothetical protein